jgi:hypothetical protein
MTDEAEVLAATVAQLAETPPKLRKEREYAGLLILAVVILAIIGLYCLFRRKKQNGRR